MKKKGLFGEEIKNESFGMLRFSRVSGNSGYLFGSDLQPNHFIIMELNDGYMSRSLSHDSYFDTNNNKVRIKMSTNQFSELITSLNYGSGVPVTIERFNGNKIPQFEDAENKKEAHYRQYKENINELHIDLSNEISDIKHILEKKSLSKADREYIIKYMEKIERELKYNIPFYIKTFKESMDKIVVEAKTEIENAIQSKIVNAGLDILGIGSINLPSSDNDNLIEK